MTDPQPSATLPETVTAPNPDPASRREANGGADGSHPAPEIEIGRMVGRIWAAHRDGSPDPIGIDSKIRARVQAVLDRLEAP